MSNAKDKNPEQESREGLNISRRDFLKDAGLVVGAPTLGSIAITAEAAAQAKKTVPAAKEAAPSGTRPGEEPVTIELTVNGGKYR